MRYIKGSGLFDGFGFRKEAEILVLDEYNRVAGIVNHAPEGSLETFEGLICPGFINTHCHLELSHMRGLLPKHTGLIPFIKGILAHREATADFIQQCMAECDREMFENGIVAVGDISNSSDSFSIKSQSSIEYHTFVEVFNLDPKLAAETFNNGVVLGNSLSNMALAHSMAPHAPYTVSQELFTLIDGYNSIRQNLSSMHNQETWEENQFFLDKTGAFNDFYRDWGFDISYFEATGKKSLQSTIPSMPETDHMLLVHNTFSEHDDIQFAHRQMQNVFWCSNPNANLYIENRLPNYKTFMDSGATITLGTDSIASNWQLSILEEIKAVMASDQKVELQDLLSWSTLNGAKALKMDNQFGSFEKGKKPGVVLISDYSAKTNSIGPDAKSKRLV